MKQSINNNSNHNIKINFVWNTVGSFTLSLTSLVFMIIATRVNGPELAGIFTFAFSFACVVQVVANYCGRSYQVTNNDKTISYSSFIYARFITNIVMIIVCVFYLIQNGYSETKTLVIIANIILRVVESIQDVFYGVLQKEELLYKVGISMFVKAILSILAFLIVDVATSNIVLASFSMPLSYLLIFAIYDLRAIKLTKFSFTKFNLTAIKKISLGGFSVFLFTLLTQYVMNAQKFAINGVLSDEMQAIFGILIMPATLMVLCSQLIVQPFMTKFSDFIDVDNYKGLLMSVIKIVSAIVLFGILTIVLAYFIGIPVLEIIYGISLNVYTIDLCIILAGAVMFGLAYAVSSALIAMRKNNFQVVIYVVVTLIAYFLSEQLVVKFQLDGAVYAYLITMVILCVLYILYAGVCFFASTKNVGVKQKDLVDSNE